MSYSPLIISDVEPRTRPSLINRFGGFYDNAISLFFPGIAFRMKQSRTAMGLLDKFATRRYEGSMPNRFTKGKNSTDGNINQELLISNDLAILRRLTRDSVRSSPMTRSLRKAFRAHVVGRGFTLQAKARNKDGSENIEFNREAEKLWAEWCEACDTRGMMNFDEICAQAINTIFDAGEYLVRFVNMPDKKAGFPLRLEIIEPDLLDETYHGDNLIGGIKIDSWGKPVEYNFMKVSKELYGIARMQDYNKISAEDVLHLFIHERPGQLRGEPLLASCLNFLQMAHRTIEAELVSTEIQACFGVVYSSSTGGAGGKFLGGQIDDKNGAGDRIRKIAPGMIAEIPGADNIQVVDPKRPGNTFEPFMRFISRWISASIDLCYEKVGKDYSQGNFSSQRMGDQNDRRHLSPIKEWLGKKFCTPIYRRFLENAILTGKIKAPGYMQDKTAFADCEFTAEPYEYIDPLKDVTADQVEIDCGFNTLKNYHAARGKDWKEVVDQIAEEQKYIKDKGAEAAFKKYLDNTADLMKELQTEEVKNAAKA